MNAAHVRGLLQEWQRILGDGATVRRRLRRSEVSALALRSWLMAGSHASSLERLDGALPRSVGASPAWDRAVVVVQAAVGLVPSELDAPALQAYCAPAVAAGMETLRTALGGEGIALATLLSARAEASLAKDLGRLLCAHVGLAAQAYRATHPITRLVSADALGCLPVTLAALCEAYPAAARLLIRACEHWISANIVLLRRLDADAAALAAWLGVPTVLPVTRLDPDQGDPHRGGQRVSRLTLAEGGDVAYKPRPLDMEVAFAEILDWARAQGTGLDQQTAEVFAREGYGWMRWCHGRAPANLDERARLAHRLGGLMAHFAVLGSYDIHAENLIVVGEYPVAVDLECLIDSGLDLLHPPREDAVRRLLNNGILPYWHADPNARGKWLNTSVLGSPHLSELAAHRDELLAGFDAVWQLWLAKGPALAVNGRLCGPLRGLRCAQGRLLLRPTNAYGRLFDMLGRPACLADSRRFAVRLDALAPRYLRAPQGARLWQALAAERLSVSKLDVPYASFRMDRQSMWLDDQEVGTHVLPMPPASALAIRLSALSKAEGNALRCTLKSVLQTPPAPAFPDRPAANRGSQAEEDAFAETARRIADHLLATAIDDGRGGAAWLGVRSEDAGGILRLQQLGDDYYAGRAGIALFLAMAGHVLKTPAYQVMARAVFEHLAPLSSAGLGRGLAGQAFARQRAALVLPGLASGALSDGQTDGAASAPPLPPLDYLQGACGWIVVACERVRHGDLPPPGLARQAARLRDALTGLSSESRVWAGQSHGLAGVARAAAALARLAGQWGKPDGARQWAAQSLALIERESDWFDPVQGEWQDGRGGPDRPAAFTSAWCHGAPGILIARLSTSRDLRHAGCSPDVLAPVARDIDRALRRIHATGPCAGDFLCCGETGFVEALLLAGQHLDRAPLIEVAHERMGALLARAAQSGFKLGDDAPMAPATSGLFDGLAGIGYQCLRLHAPSAVPSLLDV
ncbi:DUF4135 domain-containing protein [Verticiella alkaliphila]|uniref:DUF4135 domain-containing protein n=1 Tax=Verticiella alkaliphila TaxID=2779529 RepID=UPI001C0B2D02|nr:DUF4135 domain-containing protein [Verticiella sp. GG226]